MHLVWKGMPWGRGRARLGMANLHHCVFIPLLRGCLWTVAEWALDLYLRKYILHDWSDDECLTILRNCRRAAKPSAGLAVAEQLREPGTGSPFTPLMDLNMLVMLTGREHTLGEYRDLFSNAGLGQISITRTNLPMMILTADAV
jgi:hypothetical protein